MGASLTSRQGETGERRVYDLVAATADYPEWRGPPARTLIVCTQQRSGSTLLGEAMYFAGGLGCPLEYFHSGFRPGFAARWAAPDLTRYTAAVHRFRTDPSGAFAVKLFWWDVAMLAREIAPAAFAALDDVPALQTGADTYRRIHAALAPLFPNPVLIHLTRRDEVAQAVSYAVAAQTRLWREFRAARRQAPLEFQFHRIVHELARIQNHNAHWANYFAANELACHRVVYEDLAGDYAGTLRRLFATLGRPDAPIALPRLQKQADAASEDLRRQFMAAFAQRARGQAPPSLP